MKKSLIRLFQVLFVLHTFGYAQLNAGTAEKEHSPLAGVFPEHIVAFLADELPAPKIKEGPLHIQKVFELFTERFEEPDNEPGAGKQLDAGNLLYAAYYNRLNEYQFYSHPEHLAFNWQHPPVLVHQRLHVMLQVFRI